MQRFSCLSFYLDLSLRVSNMLSVHFSYNASSLKNNSQDADEHLISVCDFTSQKRERTDIDV